MIATAFPDNRTQIIDVDGNRHTMEPIQNAGYAQVFGSTTPKSMLARSRVKENIIIPTCSEKHGPFDFVVANWTLHFIPERESYMRDIHESLMNTDSHHLEKRESSKFLHDRL